MVVTVTVVSGAFDGGLSEGLVPEELAAGGAMDAGATGATDATAVVESGADAARISAEKTAEELESERKAHEGVGTALRDFEGHQSELRTGQQAVSHDPGPALEAGMPAVPGAYQLNLAILVTAASVVVRSFSIAGLGLLRSLIGL